MDPEISAEEFLDALARHEVPLTQDQMFAIESADWNLQAVTT